MFAEDVMGPLKTEDMVLLLTIFQNMESLY